MSKPTRPQPPPALHRQGLNQPASRPPLMNPAAPAYRPPAPRVLQPKAAAPRPGNPSRPVPAAPPVYRPQPPPKVLQQKPATARPAAPPTPARPPQRTPMPPPAYRPQPAPKCLQPKAAQQPQPPTARPGRAPAPPWASRPQTAPRALQAKPARPAAPPPARGPSAPHGGVVQRTVLYDANPDTITKHKDEGTFMGGIKYANEFETYQSAQLLKGLYHMEAYEIRNPLPKRLVKNEALILVGHGGGGRFMDMEPGELQQHLLDWGVGNGMKVVLAGCLTSQADDAIKVVEAITGVKPLVNQDLAYTTEYGEFTIDDKVTKSLYAERNSRLKQVDHDYVQAHVKLLKGLLGDIDDDNYAASWKLAQTLCQAVSKPAPNVPKSYTAQNASAIQKHWEKTVDDFTSARADKAIEKLNKIQTNLHYMGTGGPPDDYAEAHLKILKGALAQAKKINDWFIEEMRNTLMSHVQYKDYTADAFKGHGPVPPVLKIKQLLAGALTPQIAEHIMNFLPSYSYFMEYSERYRVNSNNNNGSDNNNNNT